MSGALFQPQGTCPKPWVAVVAGEVLCDRRGGARRFSTEAAAAKAADAASPSPKSESSQ